MSGCNCSETGTPPGPRAHILNPTCPIHGEDAQPLPVGSRLPVAHNLVKADLDARLALGIERYGQPLQPFNGRNQLRDAYEEALDLCVYLRAALYEKDNPS